MWVSGALVHSRMIVVKTDAGICFTCERKQISVKKVSTNQVQYLKQNKIQLQNPQHLKCRAEVFHSSCCTFLAPLRESC